MKADYIQIWHEALKVFRRRDHVLHTVDQKRRLVDDERDAGHDLRVAVHNSVPIYAAGKPGLLDGRDISGQFLTASYWLAQGGFGLRKIEHHHTGRWRRGILAIQIVQELRCSGQELHP